MTVRRVIVEADGGSRGNPGAAAYGALVRDADTGELIADVAETIGVTTNNVAEYEGLIAGLELAREFAPGAAVDVRMDSKLVVEQMAGNWKIKHADMRRLALRARELAPDEVTWSWIPRAENAAADALANAALDGKRNGLRHRPAEFGSGGPAVTKVEPEPAKHEAPGWGPPSTDATTFVLLRHGASPLTERKAFSGSGGDDPPLSELGLEQADRAAAHAAAVYDLDVIITSPLQRARQTAERVAGELGQSVQTDDRLRETNFGDWEGFTFSEIAERWPGEMKAWLSSASIAPPGGESFDSVFARTEAARSDLVGRFAGRTIGLVSHVGVIKMMMVAALQTPIDVVYRLELAPGSFTTIRWWGDGRASVSEFSVVPR